MASRLFASVAAWSARWARWTVVGAVVVLVSAFVELSADVSSAEASTNGLLDLDVVLLTSVAKLRRPWLSTIAIDLTALGSPVLVALVTCVAGALLLARGARRAAGALALVSLASAVATIVGKAVLERPRPTIVPRLVEVTGLSYPSGHSIAAAAVYLTLAWIIARGFVETWQKVMCTACAATLVALIALSRVYLGVHYPSDVIAGVLLGAAIASVAWFALARDSPTPTSEASP